MKIDPDAQRGGGSEELAPKKLPLANDRAPAIRIRALDVEVGGRALLEKASLDVFPGECVLLVGPSGSGKSVLLRILSSLVERDDPDHVVTGTVLVAGQDVLAEPDPKRSRTGLVFQDHALFDELSAGENLLFARDHSTSQGAQAACERAWAFLVNHAIDPHARVRSLSGGQKQRVAIARALARDPEVLLYDEPTSALDPRSARAVAGQIREAGETFGKTSIVVTHDYAPFEGRATRVVFLDPRARSLREVTFAELATIMADAKVEAPPARMPGPEGLAGLAAGAASWSRDALWTFFEQTPTFLVRTLSRIPGLLFPFGARARWFVRSLRHYSHICFFGSAIPYMVIAGIIAGFVATYFTYKFLPKKQWSEQLVLDDVLPSLGFALYRVVVPVLATILIAGRTGAALASDVGSKVYMHQITAMRTLGARPGPYVGTASLWANVIGTLILAYVCFWSATATSLGVFAWSQPGLTPYYWSTHFFTKLQLGHAGFSARGAAWVLAKLVISGAGTALIAYGIGGRPKRSGAEVSYGITATVYWATLFVLVVHLGFAFYEFDNLDEIFLNK